MPSWRRSRRSRLFANDHVRDGNYDGFEILAKAHMCHFREKRPPHVSRFVEIAHLNHPTVPGYRYQLLCDTQASALVTIAGEVIIRVVARMEV